MVFGIILVGYKVVREVMIISNCDVFYFFL